MDPRDVTNAEQARAIVEERQLEHVKVGVFDMDGILRGKYMAKEKFFSALESGFGFCVSFGYRGELDQYSDQGCELLSFELTLHIVLHCCQAIPAETGCQKHYWTFLGLAE